MQISQRDPVSSWEVNTVEHLCSFDSKPQNNGSTCFSREHRAPSVVSDTSYFILSDTFICFFKSHQVLYCIVARMAAVEVKSDPGECTTCEGTTERLVQTSPCRREAPPDILGHRMINSTVEHRRFCHETPRTSFRAEGLALPPAGMCPLAVDLFSSLYPLCSVMLLPKEDSCPKLFNHLPPFVKGVICETSFWLWNTR